MSINSYEFSHFAVYGPISRYFYITSWNSVHQIILPDLIYAAAEAFLNIFRYMKHHTLQPLQVFL